MQLAKVNSGEIKARRPKLITAKVEVIEAQTNRSTTKVDVQELDKVVERIITLDRQFVKNAYELGAALLDCHDRGLWRQRLKGDQPKYKTWSQFVDAELTISRCYAYSLMQITSSFSRVEIEDSRIGTAKLMLLQRVKEPQQRSELLEEVRTKRLGVRALKAKVQEVAPSSRKQRSTPARAGLQSWEGTIEGLTSEGLNVKIGAGTAKIPLPPAEAIKFLNHLGQKVVFSVGLS